jgi:hypothetical protein
MVVQSSTMTRPIGQPGRIRTTLRKTVLRPFPCSVLAATGIFGGLSALFVGLVCIVLHALIPGDVMFSRVGTVLLVVAIPMILIGSIFLDEIDKNKC